MYADWMRLDGTFFNFDFLMHVGVLSAFMCVRHVHFAASVSQEEAIQAP